MNRFRLLRTAFPAALCLLALLAAGDAAAIDVCGNGICATNAFPPENATNCPEDCGGGPPPPPTCTPDTCLDCQRPWSGDKELDGIPDPLEFDLAHEFFPSILLQHADLDRDESYLFRGFAIPYTVYPLFTGNNPLCDELYECLEVRYGIAFFRDRGDVPTGAYAHLGDSEMYAAVLRRTSDWSQAQTSVDPWVMIRDFTSAHWGDSWSDSSRVGGYGCTACGDLSSAPSTCTATKGCYFFGSCTGVHSGCTNYRTPQQCTPSAGCTWNGGCFDQGGWRCYDSQPKTDFVTIFAAESKHALYHTDAECDSGGLWNTDECPHNAFDMRQAKTNRLQNVGSWYNHGAFDTKIQHPNGCALYDVWGGAPFGGGTAYKSHFTAGIDWKL